MKNLFLYSIAVFLFCACSSSENKKEQTKSEVLQSVIATEQTETVDMTNSSELLTKHHEKIKEALFFHIRGTIEGLDEYRIVKSEKISIIGDQFEYELVTLPIEYVREYQDKIKVLEASTLRKKADISDDDSVSISGEMMIDSIYYNGAESIERIEIYAEGNIVNSHKYISPYAGPERKLLDEPYIEHVMVNLITPKIYPKDQYYLKARIQKLSEADLKALSNDELGYLRNEIFARHGHTFKSDKMKSYFAKQDWYKPYVDDATAWLNEEEKWNAQYIKTFEN